MNHSVYLSIWVLEYYLNLIIILCIICKYLHYTLIILRLYTINIGCTTVETNNA